MLITVSLLVLAYLVMGKDVQPLIDKVKNVDWRAKIIALMDKLRPWALRVGRATARPILQFYYVMEDENTSTLERVMIYGAIIYTIMPIGMASRPLLKIVGVLGDGVAILFVYNKIKHKITPKIRAKVEDRLNEWFGVEYEMVTK